jgi:hypothetical protein
VSSGRRCRVHTHRLSSKKRWRDLCSCTWHVWCDCERRPEPPPGQPSRASWSWPARTHRGQEWGYPHSWTSIFILYVCLSQQDFFSLYSILLHLSILYIILYPLHPLCDPLVILSKYIHMWSSFEGFIETNLMVRSKFNLNFCLWVIVFFPLFN